MGGTIQCHSSLTVDWCAYTADTWNDVTNDDIPVDDDTTSVIVSTDFDNSLFERPKSSTELTTPCI